jgi:hypothetical protein
MRIAGSLLALAGLLFAVVQAQQPITLEIRDYATMPITGAPIGKTTNEWLLSRVNVIREEPGGAERLFRDMNGQFTSSTRRRGEVHGLTAVTSGQGCFTGSSSPAGMERRQLLHL